ncbi:lipocalin [Oryzias melastigma]|uniref:Zgc:153704 n=1 Tax=Oryzias melastigma TaxID=30732 RepID=A0A3B3DXX7_ORYME|nr:lipocalin [Oryzias melastigma]
MNSVLILLGAVLCSLTVSSEVVPQADFNLQEMAGKWYLVGFAANAQWFVRRKATMKMGTAMLKPTAEGDLSMAYSSLNADGTCWKKDSLAKKTGVPGKFAYTCQRWGSVNDLTVVDAKYDEYALIHTLKTKGDDVYSVTKLYGRSPDLGAEVMAKFKQISLESGILPDNIVFLPKNGECTEA